MPRILDFSGIRLFSQIRLFPENPISLCFGALLIILRGALFSILKLTPATSENDPLFEPKSGPSILLRQVVEMRIIRQERGDKTSLLHIIKTQNSQYLQGFPAISRHYRAITSRHQIAPLQMKRALHMAACFAAYARLVFYVAIGWSSLPFSG